MSELVSKEDAANRARDIIVDTGCNWTDAATKVLGEVRLSSEDRKELLAYGLATYARNSLNRSTKGNVGPSKVPTTTQLLEPLSEFLALTRVFQVGDTRKRFIDCDANELGLIIEHLKAQRDGFTRSIKFIIDVQAECARFSCPVSELPTLRAFEEAAPW